MLIAENDRPILKGEYPVDIQEREHEVTGQPESQGEALFRNAVTDMQGIVSIGNTETLGIVSITDADKLTLSVLRIGMYGFKKAEAFDFLC